MSTLPDVPQVADLILYFLTNLQKMLLRIPLAVSLELPASEVPVFTSDEISSCAFPLSPVSASLLASLLMLTSESVLIVLPIPC